MHLFDMKLTPANSGKTFIVPIQVDETGRFFTEHDGEVYEAEQLNYLRNHIMDAITSSRKEVPFVDEYGRRGVIRGWHKGNRDMLITYANGTKDRKSGYVYVWRPDEITEEKIEHIKTLRSEIETREQELKELLSGRSEMDDLLSEAVGVDFSDWHHDPEASFNEVA